MAQSLRNIFSIFFFKFYIRVQLINSVVLVSDVQQSDSVIHHTFTLTSLFFFWVFTQEEYFYIEKLNRAIMHIGKGLQP